MTSQVVCIRGWGEWVGQAIPSIKGPPFIPCNNSVNPVTISGSHTISDQSLLLSTIVLNDVGMCCII